MAHTFSAMYTHIVFGTKDREPTTRNTADTHAYIAGIVKNLDGSALKIGGTADHVHLLVRLKPSLAIADAVEKLKANSSKWIKEKQRTMFRWQKGYAAFSVSPSAVDAVQRYIENQAEHHQKRTFRDEYLAFLEECGIEYDPRYVFE